MKHLIFAALMIAIAAVGRAQNVDDVLAAAVKAAEANDTQEAARTFGHAASLAHKAGDLLAEQRVADRLRPFLEAVSKDELPHVLARIVSALDARRGGAFVSAQALAGEIVMLGTRAGDTGHASEAAAILKARAGVQKSGKEAGALAAYAKGLEFVAAGKAADAFVPLEEALATAVAEQWRDVAIHAATEIAARASVIGDAPRATKALAAAGSLFEDKTDPDLAQTWRKLVETRLKDAAPELLAPFDAAMKPFSKGTSVSSAGGAGGAGGVASKVSPLGAAWKKLSPSQAVVAVKRVDGGFEVTAPFDPPMKAAKPLEKGLTHHREGGLTLSFSGRGVALRGLDLEGAAGAPGGSSYLPPGTPLYRLARTETWTLAKNGAVSLASTSQK